MKRYLEVVVVVCRF